MEMYLYLNLLLPALGCFPSTNEDTYLHIPEILDLFTLSDHVSTVVSFHLAEPSVNTDIRDHFNRLSLNITLRLFAILLRCHWPVQPQ